MLDYFEFLNEKKYLTLKGDKQLFKFIFDYFNNGDHESAPINFGDFLKNTKYDDDYVKLFNKLFELPNFDDYFDVEESQVTKFGNDFFYILKRKENSENFGKIKDYSKFMFDDETCNEKIEYYDLQRVLPLFDVLNAVDEDLMNGASSYEELKLLVDRYNHIHNIANKFDWKNKTDDENILIYTVDDWKNGEILDKEGLDYLIQCAKDDDSTL